MNVKSWTAGGTQFEYLETEQFIIATAEREDPLSLTIRDTKSEDNCIALYWQDQFQYVSAGTPFSIPDAWKKSLPLHITAIPWNVTGACAGANIGSGSPDGSRALAIWISEGLSQPSASTCHFKDDAAKPPECFKAPYWAVEGNFLIYKGSLVDWVMEGNKNENIPRSIFIDKGVDLLNQPLNTLFYRYPIQTNSIPACEAFARNANEGNSFGSDCFVGKGEELTLLANHQIEVGGYGRINGYEQAIEAYPSNSKEAFMDDSQKNFAQYRVYSGLLVLSSKYSSPTDVSTPAIDVKGITVGFGPKRNNGAVQLNAPYAKAASSLTDTSMGFDSNNFKVNVSDLKVVGNWIDAADGPEIMGQNSTVESLYLHVNDDSIKVAVNGIRISDVTVLQGDAGGVVDLGSYGYNRGSISDAVVDGVYVHRITHTTGYDPYNGLVTTRLCPVKPLCENCDHSSANLENATVQNLTVMKVDDINTVQRPAAIGVLASYLNSDEQGTTIPGFCTAPTATSVTISNIKLLNWDVYVEPSEDSKLYNNGTVSGVNAENKAIQYNWVYPSVAFFDSNFLNNVPENAVRLYPANSVWYAACGLPTGSCYNKNGPYRPGQPNVVTESINSDVPNFHYLFPYMP